MNLNKWNGYEVIKTHSFIHKELSVAQKCGVQRSFLRHTKEYTGTGR